MKVFIVTSTPYPTGRSATSRVKCYARAIREGGLDCEVDIFQRTELPEKVKNSKANGVDCGIPYRYIGGTSIRHRIKYLRPLFDIIDKCRMGWYLNQNMSKGDILFLYMGGKVEWMLHFMRVAHKRGAFCVRDLCELPRGTGIETETAIRLRKNIIKRQFPLLDGIISISDTLLNLARTYTLPQCKHLKIPILVDYNQYVLPDRSSEADVPFIFHTSFTSGSALTRKADQRTDPLSARAYGIAHGLAQNRWTLVRLRKHLVQGPLHDLKIAFGFHGAYYTTCTGKLQAA